MQRYGDEYNLKTHDLFAQDIYLGSIKGQVINVLLQLIFHKHACPSWTLEYFTCITLLTSVERRLSNILYLTNVCLSNITNL